MRAVVVALLAAAVSIAAPRAQDAGTVRLDVVAEDKAGRLVEGLTAADFEVVENGAALPVSAVRLVKSDGALAPGESARAIASPADEREEASRDGTRVVALFLDEFHTTPGDGAARARELAAEFVERTLGPRDLVLVVRPLDSLLTLRLTRDRAAVAAAIAAFEGRRGVYEPRSALEASLSAGSRARTDAVRVQVATSTLHAIAAHLGRLGGSRKALLFVSEGFPPPAGRRGEGALPTIESAIRVANRGAVSMYPLDPRALAAAAPAPAPAGDDAADDGRGMLARLAAETGGVAMLAASSVRAGLDRIGRDTGAHYLLTLAASGADGSRAHPVTVSVRRPGVAVRARRSYWVPAPIEPAHAASAPARAPMPPPLQPRRSSPLIRPWFGMARAADGAAQVSFVWEPVGRVPGERGRPPIPARIAFKAFAPDGEVVYEGSVRSAAAPLGPPDVPPQLRFSAPAGRLRVEMSIEDATSRVIDTDVRDVMVRTPGGPVALATPKVLRSRTAREHAALGADPDAVPVAVRQFSRAERLWIRTAAYGEGAPPEVAARLVSAIGGAMRPLPVQPGAPGVHQVDLPLASLAAGEYAVEFTAAGGGREAKETVAFRVTP